MEGGGIAPLLLSLLMTRLVAHCFEVGMSSSSSPSSSSRSVSKISSSGSDSCWVEVISSSSGDSTPADSRAFAALQVIRSWHDVDSVVPENLLGLIWDRYSIPKDYELHAPHPGQHPYDPFLAAPGYPRMPPLVGDFPILDSVELLALSGGFPWGVSGSRDRTDPNSLLGLLSPIQEAGRVLSNHPKWVQD